MFTCATVPFHLARCSVSSIHHTYVISADKLTHFRFLSGHKYRNHPQRTNLISSVKMATDTGTKAVSTLETILTLLRGTIEDKTYSNRKTGANRTKKLFTIKGVAPPDLLACNRPEPALVPYSAAQSIKDQGLVQEDDNESDGSEDGQPGPSTSRQARVQVIAGGENDDEMLLTPESEARHREIMSGLTTMPRRPLIAPAATRQVENQQLQSPSVPHVGESTTGGKRKRDSLGGRADKGKRVLRDEDGDTEDSE